MSEPAHDPLSIPRESLPAFTEAIKRRADPGPYPFFPDNSLRYAVESPGFRLRIHAANAYHFSLAAQFIEDGARLHLVWKMESKVPAAVVPVIGGIVVFIGLFVGLTSTGGPQWFFLLWAAGFGTVIYINYRKMVNEGIAAQKRFLECIRESIDEAERVTHATPRQSALSPSETKP